MNETVLELANILPKELPVEAKIEIIVQKTGLPEHLVREILTGL